MKTVHLAGQMQSVLRPARRGSVEFPFQGMTEAGREPRKTNTGVRAAHQGETRLGAAGLEIHEIWEEKRGDKWVTCILGRDHGVPVGLEIDARGRAFANGGAIPSKG